MDKYYSYTDFLRAVGQKRYQEQHEKLLDDIYMDLFLKSLQRSYRIEKLYELIDEALDTKDSTAFYDYTNELLQLEKVEH